MADDSDLFRGSLEWIMRRTRDLGVSKNLTSCTATRQHHRSIVATLHTAQAFPSPHSPTAPQPHSPRRHISHHCSDSLAPRSPPLPDHGQQQPLITSRRNPLVKHLRQLHTTRGRREAEGVLLEGTHLLEEALRHGLALQRLVFTQRWAENHPALLAQVPPVPPTRQ